MGMDLIAGEEDDPGIMQFHPDMKWKRETFPYSSPPL